MALSAGKLKHMKALSNQEGIIAAAAMDQRGSLQKSIASAKGVDAKAVTPMKGKGCDRCNNTGYKGRVALYEVMETSEELSELILIGASGLELRRKAVDEGMITLRQSGLRKVKDGITTIEEVVRETVK